MTDTTKVIVQDSSTLIKNGRDQIILIQEKKKAEDVGWMENPIVSSFLMPVLAAGFTALILNFINRRSNRLAIEKLEQETNQIKRDFQPYVLATLQETQKEIFKSKLEALKSLVNLSKEYYNFDQQYYYGEAIMSDAHDYYQHIYSNFGKYGHTQFQKFISDYEYLFPTVVTVEFIPIKKTIQELYESNKKSDSVRQLEMTVEDEERIKSLPGSFEKAIKAMRKDLHLDNNFVHVFLDTYQIKK
jgi:hypothetical protein